jgi:hypothetical protein
LYYASTQPMLAAEETNVQLPGFQVQHLMRTCQLALASRTRVCILRAGKIGLPKAEGSNAASYVRSDQ